MSKVSLIILEYKKKIIFHVMKLWYNWNIYRYILQFSVLGLYRNNYVIRSHETKESQYSKNKTITFSWFSVFVGNHLRLEKILTKGNCWNVYYPRRKYILDSSKVIFASYIPFHLVFLWCNYHDKLFHLITSYWVDYLVPYFSRES